MFRRLRDVGELEIFIVIHADDNLVAARDTVTLERFVVGLLDVRYQGPRGRQLLYGVSNHAFPGGRCDRKSDWGLP